MAFVPALHVNPSEKNHSEHEPFYSQIKVKKYLLCRMPVCTGQLRRFDGNQTQLRRWPLNPPPHMRARRPPDGPRLYSIFIFLPSQTKLISQAPFSLQTIKAGRRGTVLWQGVKCKSCFWISLQVSGHGSKQKLAENSLRTSCWLFCRIAWCSRHRGLICIKYKCTHRSEGVR